jgi:hypothetical protein
MVPRETRDDVALRRIRQPRRLPNSCDQLAIARNVQAVGA